MRVLITGGTGTLGHALVPKLLERGDEPIVYSRDEYKHFVMREEFPDAFFILGDVRDADKIDSAIEECDVVIHAAALKHLNQAEIWPDEALRTNVLGSENVVSGCLRHDKRATLVSSDKAVYPTSVYGMTKALAERLFLSAGLGFVRYGNVLGSRGSLLEVIDRCKKIGEPIPVTDKRMTRFWWSIDDAADFVLAHLGEPGGHIPKLRRQGVVGLIEELAPGHPIVEVGKHPREKLHEWLETVEENPNATPSGPPRTIERYEAYLREQQDTTMSTPERCPVCKKGIIDSATGRCSNLRY